MFSISVEDYGYRITFDGYLDDEVMFQWLLKSYELFEYAPISFGVFVDLRKAGVIPASAAEKFIKAQVYCKEKGMKRSVIILEKAIIQMQFTRISKETGIYRSERYVNALEVEDWERVGIRWIKEGVDPDKPNDHIEKTLRTSK